MGNQLITNEKEIQTDVCWFLMINCFFGVQISAFCLQKRSFCPQNVISGTNSDQIFKLLLSQTLELTTSIYKGSTRRVEVNSASSQLASVASARVGFQLGEFYQLGEFSNFYPYLLKFEFWSASSFINTFLTSDFAIFAPFYPSIIYFELKT